MFRLGILAQDRGGYDEAARQCQRFLDISERLGDQVGIASSYSTFAALERQRGGPASAVVTWHVRALAIKLRLGIPRAVFDLERLAAAALLASRNVRQACPDRAEHVGEFEVTEAASAYWCPCCSPRGMRRWCSGC
jgi:hypothetical protein